MLSAQAVACAALALACAAYVQANGVPAFVQGWFVTRGAAEAQLLQLYRPTNNLLLRAVGYAALALFGYAWCFWVVTALAAAWQRYRYVPVGTTTRPPPAPGTQGGGGEQQLPQTPAAAAAPTVPAAAPQHPQQRVAPRAAAAAAVAARTPAPPTPQPQQPLPVPERQQERQQAAAGGDPHDAARRRALEAAQRALDAQAAALKASRDQQDAERRARLAATAAAAEAAAAAAARQAPLAPAAPPPPAAQASSSAAAAAAADQDRDSLATARQLRDEQDWEYQQSLAADRAHSEQRSAAAKEQQRRAEEQQRLTALRQRLQAELPPEPQDGQDGSGVSIRVRLPDGSHASRRFARADAFCRVHDWVFTLPAMPLLRPGSWSLASSWPRQRLAPAPAAAGDGGSSSGSGSSIWIADGWAREVAAQQHHEAQAAAQLAPGEWLLDVRQVAGEQLAVRVSSTTRIADVKQAVQEQTGLAPSEQRLIFSGRVLTSGSSLAQLGIGPGHVLQLAPRTSSSSSPRDSKSGPEGGDAAVGAGESSDAIALATVGELADHVGSSQLALFVA